MSIFAGAQKCDLKILAAKLGETVNDSHKLKDLKKMILASKEYDEESAKEWLNTIINERKEREENERRNEEIQMEERRRKEEQEVAERRHQEEIELRKQEYEERLRKEEYEERKRKDEMEFELQKIRLGAEGSLCCLLKTSVAQKLKIKPEPTVNEIYGLGNQKMPALTSIRRIKTDIEVDNVKAENISIHVVPDDVASVDLIIGRTWLDLPHIAYTKIGERFHIGYRKDELFRNFPIDEKVNPVYLKRLETVQSESESLQIKDTSQQKMMGNLADDLKMVKNELRILQGDIKNFKEKRQLLLLQIQKKNKNVDNLKSINNSLAKTNSYYDKNKSGKVLLRKGDIVAVKRKPNTTGESTKTQPRYRGPMVVTEIRPSDTYRISQLEPRNGRPCATIVHVSQLKAWRSWNEDDDDSSTNSHNEPEMQRSN
ncbi:hypothetical protein AVEN_273932-1 [Araneus ventricosus]|uniref:Uncharacterized protein n=1 Tax=Araneus ventricosus TaxID=182803 RepID=A0A4Y2I0U1_ARAVE|nr:hypothetical protein AVEN_273932-1 [Araneus ventricosus]